MTTKGKQTYKLQSRHISDASQDFICCVDADYQNTDTIRGLSTGIDELDKEIKGINNGELVLVGRHAPTDSSSFLLKIICDAAERFQKNNNKNVLFFSLNHSTYSIIKSIMCLKNKIAHKDLKENITSYKQFEVIMKYKKAIENMPIYINNTCYSLKKIRQEIESIGAEKIGLIVIEKLQSLEDYARAFFGTQSLILELKNLAKQYNVPVIIARDMNKEESEKSMEDIARSSISTQYIDKILFLKQNFSLMNFSKPQKEQFDNQKDFKKEYNYWEKTKNKDEGEILIAKSYRWLYKKIMCYYNFNTKLFEIMPEEDIEYKKIHDELSEKLENKCRINKDIYPELSTSLSTEYSRFNVELLNTDTDLRDFDKQIKASGKLNFSLCLYGASGTGKTAYANYLAQSMGLKVLEKRASDLIGPYVGETEKSISNAFREARANKSVLIFDEGDSFLQNRANAIRIWEITQVNEMLTQMEKHPYPFICTTNLMENIDAASLRRFTFKIKYNYMTEEQIQLAFKYFFDLTLEKPCSLCLAPGDFNVVRRKAEILGMLHNKNKLLEMLEQEQECREPIKKQKIGFI